MEREVPRSKDSATSRTPIPSSTLKMEGTERRNRLKSALREFATSPAVWTIIVYFLASPFIIAGGAYLFLRSFLIVPGGAIAWCFLISFSLICALSFVYGIWIELPKHRSKLAVAGIRPKPNFWPVAISYIALKLAMAPAVALSCWGDLQGVESRMLGKGKIVVLQPHDKLRSALKTIEREGIFTWFFAM